MTRRVVIGKRANGELGVFVARAGYDAFTAADSDLVLNISSKISQLLMLGFVTSSGSVPLGVGAAPYIMLTGQADMTSVPLYGSLSGPVRPAPLGIFGATASGSYADVASDGSSMYVTTAVKCSYAVFNVPL